MLRKLPYGANYLDWADMTELRQAIEQKVLFRYQTLGESVATRLEQKVCDLFKTRHALAVHNCTEAIRLSLLSTRPSVGDVVYIPAVTFVAVAGAVLSCGLIPYLIDVDDDLSLDCNKLPKGAERVILAHMEGGVGKVPEDVPFVIEDGAQALGATHRDGRHAGAVGYAGVFSFHHNKILTSGEGGIVITNSTDCWEFMRKYHDHGCERIHGEYPRWETETFYGENFVTSEPIAAIQMQQFRYLNTIKGGLERGYQILREQVPLTGPFRILERKSGDIKLSLRLEFESEDLQQRAITLLQDAGLPYWTLSRYFLPDHPVLLHRCSIYSDGFPWNLAPKNLPSPEDFQRTKRRLARVLCLPISPEVGEAEQLNEAEAFIGVLERL